MTVALMLPELPATAQGTLEAAVAQSLSDFEQCVNKAKARTLAVKAEAARRKFFAGLVKTCD